MVEGELVLNAVKDSSLDSRRSERLEADPLRMTLIPDNLQWIGLTNSAREPDRPEIHFRATQQRPVNRTGWDNAQVSSIDGALLGSPGDLSPGGA
jgi:hypothetical protein